MFPSCKSSGLLLLLLYTGCFLLFSPLGSPRHGAAAVSFSFDFANSSSYDRRVRFDGDGRVRENLVDLTCKSFTDRDCMGRMLYDLPVPFHHNGEVASFATRFTFRIVLPPPGRRKGDGMAFFLARYPSAPPNNSEGRGLGLMDRDMTPFYDPAWFVAVEFDTYNNSFDPQESLDHIGVDLGSLKSANTTSLPSFRLNGTMTASINFTGSTRMLVARLHFDDHPSVPPVEVSAGLPELKSSSLPSEVAVGFSASTGADVERHQILSWSFNSTLDAKKTISRGTLLIVAASVLGTCVFLVVVWIILSRFMWKRRRNSLMEGAGPRQFRYRDLAQATDNFSEKRKLGEGAFGAVYLGKSFKVDQHGGQRQDVAIKEIFKGSTEGTKDFLAEVTTVSKTKHKNLVSLEGWCCCNTGSWNLMCWCCLKQVDHKLFLVYELMPLGDLDHHLHKKATVLPWPARYKIATGIGSALVYLHHDCQPYILHRDIKPGNILLDDNYNPKLADFGLSRIANKNNATLVTNAVGTDAYMDPKCKKHGGVKFPCSTDVYSFGLVLVEIACARCKTREEVWELYRSNGGAVPMVDAEPNERLRGMVEAAVDERLRGMVEAVADVRLGGEFHREQMQRVLVVGLWCSLSEGAHRPSMRQALRTLEQDDTPLPNLASFYSGVIVTSA